MRVRSSYPTGPFPFLIDPLATAAVPPAPRNVLLTSLQRQVLQRLRDGARLMFDVDEKRALLYDFKHGIRALAQLTIRSLAGLVRAGYLKAVQHEGHLVHYELATQG